MELQHSHCTEKAREDWQQILDKATHTQKFAENEEKKQLLVKIPSKLVGFCTLSIYSAPRSIRRRHWSRFFSLQPDISLHCRTTEFIVQCAWFHLSYRWYSWKGSQQGSRSIWDRGDTYPQRVPPIFGLGDIITNVPLNISRVITATFYPCNIFLISWKSF